ncbi:hypothetical protein ABT187_47155, partial [Streptomyces sp. NPDC001817]
LAHNEWDPVKGRAVPKLLFTFGREDDLDREAVKRLVASLSRLLEPGDALAATTTSDLEYVSLRAFGGAYVLDQLWHRLKIDQIVGRVGQPKRGRRRDMTATERVLSALVANRALAPSSKLAAADWIKHDVHIDALSGTDDGLIPHFPVDVVGVIPHPGDHCSPGGCRSRMGMSVVVPT